MTNPTADLPMVRVTPAELPVSKIGLGCVTFGREIDEAASHALLDHALAHGVRLFDTAAAYGRGTSETILGHWLTSRRPADITVATKIQITPDRDEIEEKVNASLRRLGVGQIDLLYLHQWQPEVESRATLSALDRTVTAGKIRALGVSNFTEAQLRSVLALQQQHGVTRFSVVQNNHNLAVSDLSPSFRQYCAEQNVAVVTYSPLGAGFLTGKHRAGVQPGSRFDLVPGHQDVYFHAASHRRLARLEAVAARTGLAPAHLAIAWILHQPGIHSVLVGGRTRAHLDQALAALGCDDAAVFAELTSEI